MPKSDTFFAKQSSKENRSHRKVRQNAIHSLETELERKSIAQKRKPKRHTFLAKQSSKEKRLRRNAFQNAIHSPGTELKRKPIAQK